MTIAGFVADPLWSSTQVVPPAGTFVAPIVIDGPGTLWWWATPYNGASQTDSRPAVGTTLTVDARLVYLTDSVSGTAKEVIGRPSVAERFTAALPIGREIPELYMPPAQAYLQMIALGGAAAATHLWISYRFQRRGT